MKAFRILELDEKKGSRTRFSWKFLGTMLHFFFGLFSLVSLTELCLFWYGLKDLFTLHKLADKVVLDH